MTDRVEHEPVYDINNARDECAACDEPWPCQQQRDARFSRLAAAVEYDNGLAVQMARYSNEDVRWLVAELVVLRAQRDAALAACDAAVAEYDKAATEATAKDADSPAAASRRGLAGGAFLVAEAVRAALGVQQEPGEQT